MYEQILLGIIQGITEWLPISSEGLIVLIKTNFFKNQQAITLTIREALFLHLGTFLAAFIYFYKDIIHLIKALFRIKHQPAETKNTIVFLMISTLISGVLGVFLLKIVGGIAEQFDQAEKFITILIGLLLFVTGFLELKAKKDGYKKEKDLKLIDGVILGIVQGFAALPGLSRSGLTVSALLLRRFDKTLTLKLSFLMSLPVVLGGNLILNYDTWQWPPETYAGVFFSFLFGLATIHILLRLAEKINFGYFVIFFGCLTLLSVLI